MEDVDVRFDGQSAVNICGGSFALQKKVSPNRCP